MLTVQLSLLALTFALLAGAAFPQPPQSTPPPAPQKTDAPQNPGAVELPVDIDRIQRALANTPRLRFDKDLKPVFRVQVFGEKPTIEDILGPDFARGPVPHGGMTHQEFLNLVTPKDVQGYAAFSNEEAATVAATSFLLQWTLQRAIQKYRETRDEQARAAARQEVLDALEALEKARAKAGKR
ncbi:MAG TPA: hypothetical protein VM364_05705 [Vicinamibacterales bacterium]|nr:hypothetical protein [Vicinamibacterales bacterium]